MPEVNPGESRGDYLSRCVPYVMDREKLTNEQAVGKCEGMYDENARKSMVLKKRYGNIVEHAATGLQLPEKLAVIVEDAAKSLPKDFGYRRFAEKAEDFSIEPGERTDVSFITTDDVDRDGEVVMPHGGDWSRYDKIVTCWHDYKSLPAGTNWWIRPKSKGVRNGLVAKTHYPTKPADWGDSPWMPSAILHFMQQPVPGCTGKSIGFIPLNVRGATAEEKSMRPELKDRPIIDKWLGIEYAVAPVPCNPAAQMQAVAKGIAEGVFDRSVAEVFAKAFNVELKDLDATPQGKPAEPAQPPAAEIVPFYSDKTMEEFRRKRLESRKQQMAAHVKQAMRDIFTLQTGK